MTISVGYRVNSIRGTQFRIWATQKLREFIVNSSWTMTAWQMEDLISTNYNVVYVTYLAKCIGAGTFLARKFYSTLILTAAELIVERASKKQDMGLGVPKT